MDPMNVPAKFEVRSFTRSWDLIATGVLGFGVGLRTPNLGKRRPYGGSGMVPFE